MRNRWLRGAVLGLAVLGVAGVGQPTAPRDSLAILIDGSSTVGPITEAVAKEFLALAPRARISVGISGTSGGFRRFLAGRQTSTTPLAPSARRRSPPPGSGGSSTSSS